MTKAKAVYGATDLALYAEGHAAGSPEVCAGVSALLYALAAWVGEQREREADPELAAKRWQGNVGKGSAAFRMPRTPETEPVFHLVRLGLDLLSGAAPKALEVRSGGPEAFDPAAFGEPAAEGGETPAAEGTDCRGAARLAMTGEAEGNTDCRGAARLAMTGEAEGNTDCRGAARLAMTGESEDLTAAQRDPGSPSFRAGAGAGVGIRVPAPEETDCRGAARLAMTGEGEGNTDCRGAARLAMTGEGGEETVPAPDPAAERHARASAFARERCRSWLAEAEALRGRCPDFDLGAMAHDRVFTLLLAGGVPMEAAYRAADAEGLARRAAAAARRELAERIRANAARPTEAGAAAQPAFALRPDPGRMDAGQVREVLARIDRRERVSFG